MEQTQRGMVPDKIKRKDLDELIARILNHENGEIPCMSATVRRLMSLDPESDVSMQELAEIILEDYGLINKVLIVVNSSFYRRTNTEITTVTQAVIMLGFNTVRSIAVDMAILDLLSDRSSREARRVIAQTFLAANFANAIQKLRNKGQPEAIFVASLYRPIARIVTVLQEPKLYARLAAMERSDSSAERQVARDFFRETAYRLAELWSVPSRLAGFMEGCKQFASSVDKSELELVRNAGRLSALLLSNGSPDQINKVIKSFDKNFGLDRGVVLETLEKAIAVTGEKTKDFADILGNINLREMIDAPGARAPGAVTHRPNELGMDSESETRDAGEDDRDELFLDLLNQITNAILENKFTIDQVLLLAVEVIRRGLGPVNIALCLFTPDRKRLVVRYALGEQAGLIKKFIDIQDPLKSSPLKAAFQKDCEVMGTWKQLMPNATVEATGELFSNQLCASPVQVKGKALGCILCDFSPSRKINGKDMKKIAQVRRLVVISAMQRLSGG